MAVRAICASRALAPSLGASADTEQPLRTYCGAVRQTFKVTLDYAFDLSP